MLKKSYWRKGRCCSCCKLFILFFPLCLFLLFSSFLGFFLIAFFGISCFWHTIYLRQIYIKAINYAVISLLYLPENAISKLHQQHHTIQASTSITLIISSWVLRSSKAISRRNIGVFILDIKWKMKTPFLYDFPYGPSAIVRLEKRNFICSSENPFFLTSKYFLFNSN